VCLRPGEVAVVPPGVAHRFWNATDRSARHLVFLLPGGLERCFDELAAMIRESGKWPPRDPAVMSALIARHDLHPVPAGESR
jgi:hypothetical protein